MNLIECIREETLNDDGMCREIDHGSSVLMNLYREANKKGKDLIDDALTCICGWTFKTILEKTCMSHDSFRAVMAYGPLELPLHVDDTPLGKIALIRINGGKIPNELLIEFLD